MNDIKDINYVHYEYPTTDIVLAAALKLNGARLQRIELVDGRRGIFYFGETAQSFLDAFNTGQVMVEAVAFHAEIRALTTAISRMKGRQ